MTTIPTTAALSERGRIPLELEYCAPALVFGIMTTLEGYFAPELYPAIYTAKVIAVTATLLLWRRPLTEIKPAWNVVLPSVLVGAAIIAFWIAGERWIPYPHLGERSGYDPFTALPPAGAAAFLAVRFYGLVLLVPVFEEILWRSFLLRYITNPDMSKVPIGAFSTVALLLVCAAASLSHTEWLVALGANLVFCFWLKRTRSLFAVIVAHAAANLLLGVYVLTTGNWQLW
jgi:CAAX prenyl protease-like protein